MGGGGKIHTLVVVVLVLTFSVKFPLRVTLNLTHLITRWHK